MLVTNETRIPRVGNGTVSPGHGWLSRSGRCRIGLSSGPRNCTAHERISLPVLPF
jgi:hypothetical protein